MHHIKSCTCRDMFSNDMQKSDWISTNISTALETVSAILMEIFWWLNFSCSDTYWEIFINKQKFNSKNLECCWRCYSNNQFDVMYNIPKKQNRDQTCKLNKRQTGFIQLLVFHCHQFAAVQKFVYVLVLNIFLVGDNFSTFFQFFSCSTTSIFPVKSSHQRCFGLKLAKNQLSEITCCERRPIMHKFQSLSSAAEDIATLTLIAVKKCIKNLSFFSVIKTLVSSNHATTQLLKVGLVL